MSGYNSGQQRPQQRQGGANTRQAGNAGINSGGQASAESNVNIYSPEFDIVAHAEKVISRLQRDNYDKLKLTTTQIRKFLSAVNLLNNKVMIYRVQNQDTNKLSAELVAEVRYLKIKLAYQSGREATVKDFAIKSSLEKAITDIGDSMSKYNKFSKYVEALVAYRKYAGGDK